MSRSDLDYSMVKSPFKYEMGLSLLRERPLLVYEGYRDFFPREEKDICIDEGWREAIGDEGFDAMFKPLWKAVEEVGASGSGDGVGVVDIVDEDVVFVDSDSVIRCGWVTFPTGWDIREAVGKDFWEVHAPVPEMEHIERAFRPEMYERFVEPVIRWSWGCGNEPKMGRCDPSSESDFETLGSEALRGHVFYNERQTLMYIPEVQMTMFTIRYSEINMWDVPTEVLGRICESVLSMSEDVARYKEIDVDAVVRIGRARGVM